VRDKDHLKRENAEPLQVGQKVDVYIRRRNGRLGAAMHTVTVEKMTEEGTFGTWWHGMKLNGVKLVDGEWVETSSAFIYMDQLKQQEQEEP
jgi:hypothetical protein